jgi:hypothetical protein
VPAPTAADARVHGSLNLLVNGRAFPSTCRAGHVYTRTVTTLRTRTMRLRIMNTPAGATGSLRVIVARPGTNVSAAHLRAPVVAARPATTTARTGAPLVSEAVTVPARSARVWSVGAVQKGASYQLTVSGTATLGGGAASDGRCLSSAGRWYPRASMDRWFPDNDHGKLYVDGVPFKGTATTGGAVCGGRSHVLTWTALRTGRLELAVDDPFTRGDNSGQLLVEVRRTATGG